MFTGFRNTYGTPPVTPVANTLNITATNVATVTIDPIRARVNCNADLVVTTDGPITITLAGCPTTHAYTSSAVRKERSLPMRRRL